MSISQLTIEYSGDEVVCDQAQLKSDSSVYLAGCTVAGRSVDYTYGKEEAVTYDAYAVGDEVSYNNVDYYVIKDSGANESTVTLLKAEPITSSEISSYLSSTEIANKVDTSKTYVKIAYYSRDNCVSSGDQSGCSINYSLSDVKQVVDVWETNYASGATEARLVTVDEISTLGYVYIENDTGIRYETTENTPGWVYNNNYRYWTMSQYNDSVSDVWDVSLDGSLYPRSVSLNDYDAIRPVIVINKSVLN